jgi:hypothetical protein
MVVVTDSNQTRIRSIKCCRLRDTTTVPGAFSNSGAILINEAFAICFRFFKFQLHRSGWSQKKDKVIRRVYDVFPTYTQCVQRQVYKVEHMQPDES